MDITNCSKEELAQAVLELTIELGKTRRALNAARENLNVKEVKFYKGDPTKEFVSTQTSFPTLDPMAVDPRSVV